MKLTPLKIPEVIVIEPEVFEDERGFFYEAFNQKKFNESIGRNITFVQDNHSKSKQAVLRGLHYQEAPFEQAKLIRVVSGEIFDVAVDINNKSETYGKWVGEFLSDENKRQLWIPEGFAHGFLVISRFAEVIYKTNNFYSRSSEKIINAFDPQLKILWPKFDNYLMNTKDKNSAFLK